VPRAMFNAIQGVGQAGNELIQQPVDGVFFTGSNRTGQAIAEALARRMIPVQLELGGKDPCYVCDDVKDIKAVADAVTDGAMYNAGQSCCSVERVYVHERVYDEFLEHAANAAKSMKVGDPTDAATYMGPLALPDQPSFLQAQVDDAVRQGARLHCGGAVDPAKPRFYPPTVLSDATPSMDVMTHESFGPIMPVTRVASDDEALALMNETAYGLTASVFSSDEQRAERLLGGLNAGTVYMNCCDRVTPFLPWSGRNGSGMGSTLSRVGIQAFTRPKSYQLRA